MVETMYEHEKNKEIVVDQVAYINGFEPIPVEKSNKNLLQMNQTLHGEFRTLVPFMGHTFAILNGHSPHTGHEGRGPSDAPTRTSPDGSHRVAQTIGVTVNGRWVQYSYCLSSLLGATGQVLDQDFLPSEAHEHVEKQFKKRLRFLKAAGKPPPRFGCFDDVAKMRHAFLRWVKDVWEEDPEDIKDYRTPQVVLDIQHFKMLLLEGLEESHPDFKEITSEVGQALGRLLGYKNFYTTPEDVREDFQRIYNKYTSLVGGKVLPVGSRFVKTAEFGVACAMGKALKDGTPFEFTGLKAMQKGLSQGGILASRRAGRAGTTQLDKDREYWRSLWLKQEMVRVGYVPGTSIVEWSPGY